MKLKLVKFNHAVKIGTYEEITANDTRHDMRADYDVRAIYATRRPGTLDDGTSPYTEIPFENVTYLARVPDEQLPDRSEGSTAPARAKK